MEEEVFGTPGSLYISDLHNDITESSLRDMIGKFGAIKSIIVRKYKSINRVYAFVSFEELESARKCFLEYNFKRIKGIQITIQWCDKQSRKLRESGEGTLLVTGLESSIQQHELFKLFNADFEVLFCHIPMRVAHNNGYGFVQFKDPSVLQKAIEKYNGTILHDQKISLEVYNKLPVYKIFTHIEISNIPDSLNNSAALTDLCKLVDEVENIEVNDSNRTAVIKMATHDGAQGCLDLLNGVVIDNTALDVEMSSREITGIDNGLIELVTHICDEQPYTTIFLRNLGPEVDCGQRVRELCDPFGRVRAPCLKLGEDKKPLGTATCSMATHEDALSAIAGLSAKGIAASRAMTREESLLLAADNEAKLWASQQNSARDKQIFVEFDTPVTEADLTDIFTAYGQVMKVIVRQKCAAVIFKDSAAVNRAATSSVIINGQSVVVRRYSRSTDLPAVPLGQSYPAPQRFPFRREPVEKLRSLVGERGGDTSDTKFADITAEVARFMLNHPKLIDAWINE